jgi:hypothetical protein
MIKFWLSKLTSQAVIPAAVIALAISPVVASANTPSKAKRTLHHNVRQSVQFQGNKPAKIQGSDGDSWYTPPRSPGFHDLFGS